MSFFVFACVVTVFWLVTCGYLLVNTRRIGLLKNVPPTLPATPPSLDIIVAVRNEAADVAQALQSLCHLDYPAYRLLVVNDRSTDGTGPILQQFATQYPLINVTTITELPTGWLGKNHALYKGALLGNGDWFLFTDADVVYTPDALNRAMAYVLQHQLDYLAVMPGVTSRSRMFNAIYATFKMILQLKLRPWKTSDPRSAASMGVGAFMLMKRSAYMASGTHERIRLRPDDDLQLGAQLKRAGFRQDVLVGEELLQLEWYPSVRAFVQGLMKNTFSVMHYNFALAMLNALAAFLVLVVPVPLLLVLGHWPERCMALAVLLGQWACFSGRPGANAKWWYALTIPYAGLIMSWIVLRAAWLTLQQKGIYWRDSFYPLSELKKQA